MARKEKDFCTELKQSSGLISPVFWWKIPDAGFRNHFDIVACYLGAFVAIEAKISKQKTCINFKQLFRNRDHELAALKKVRLSGGRPFIFINVFLGAGKNWCYALAYKDYKWLSWNETVMLETMDRFFVRHQKKKGIWPLKDMLNG